MLLNINIFFDFICIDDLQYIKLIFEIIICIGYMVLCNFVFKRVNINNLVIVVNKSVLKI